MYQFVGGYISDLPNFSQPQSLYFMEETDEIQITSFSLAGLPPNVLPTFDSVERRDPNICKRNGKFICKVCDKWFYRKKLCELHVATHLGKTKLAAYINTCKEQSHTHKVVSLK